MATDQQVTVAGVAGAFVGGAIAGAVAAAAVPLAGTLLGVAGIAATNTALAGGAMAVNAVGGAISYVAGGGVQNGIDQLLGNSPTFEPTWGGAMFSAGVGAILTPIASAQFPVTNNIMRTIAQANHFMPRTLNSTINAVNLYLQTSASVAYGTIIGTIASSSTSTTSTTSTTNPTVAKPTVTPTYVPSFKNVIAQ